MNFENPERLEILASEFARYRLNPVSGAWALLQEKIRTEAKSRKISPGTLTSEIHRRSDLILSA